MWQGHDGNSVQASAGTLIIEGSDKKDYGADNLRLISVVQGSDDELAQEAMSDLVERNMGLVRSIALKFRDRGAEMEDLLQIGTIGIIKAARSFDLERGTSFSTYAVPLVFGEIRRYMRDEGPIKIGRYYKKLGAMLTSCKSKILLEEGRDAKLSELAELCGVEVEEAAIALDAMAPPVSLSDSAYGETEGDITELGDTIADKDTSSDIERLCESLAIAQAISKMPDTWQKIVLFRFYRNKTQQQTATLLGLTQVKISREEKKILEFLREELTV